MNTLPDQETGSTAVSLSTGRRRHALPPAAGAWLVCLVPLLNLTAAASDEPTVRYPDGTPQRVQSVDEDGRRHGEFSEFYPTGKPKTLATYNHGELHGPAKAYHANGRLRMQATYANGRLQGPYTERGENGQLLKQLSYRAGKPHGPCRTYDTGKLVRDEYWLDGTLLIPRMPAIIQQQLEMIRKAPVPTVGEIPDLPPAVAPAVAASVRAPQESQLREDAVRALMGYRFLCGVPHDLQLDRNYTAHNVVTCALLNAVDRLTHDPPNPGWPLPQYEFGKQGAARSNLYTAWSEANNDPPSMVTAIQSWMDDSDSGNISRLGHRRWCLNPQMLKLGIASSGKYCAMWAFDGSREQVPDWDFVAFPPQGLLPVKAFKSSYAWHASLHPTKYQPPRQNAVKVRIVRAQVDLARGEVQRAAEALPLDFFQVDLDGFGIPNAIIFRPKDLELAAGHHFWVEITGLADAQGKPAQLQYLVGFFAS